MRDPSPEHILELRSVTGDDPVLLTLAPERRGALKAIEVAVAQGIVVSLGFLREPYHRVRIWDEVGGAPPLVPDQP